MLVCMISCRKRLFLFSLLLVSVSSCSEVSPSGFWLGFHPDNIVDEHSDQGPWGGVRKIKWTIDAHQPVTESELLAFAVKNDWKLIRKLVLIDRITPTDSDYSWDVIKEAIEDWPKARTIYMFETDWVAVEPGNARETQINGFVIMNAEGTRLGMFHRWGE